MADDKMNMATSDQLIGMTRSDPVMELLWENGQVFARGLSSNPSCVTYPPSNMKFRAKNDENMFGSRTRRLDHYSGQEECSKLQNSTQQDGHGGLFPGLYQNDFNLFFENTRNFDGVDSQVVPVCKNGSSRNGSKLNPQLTVPELQNQETGSDRRGLGMQSFSIPETLLIADNKSRSGLGISAPEKMRSNVVLEPAICAKDAKSFKNRPDYHKMSAKMKFVGEPPKEAPHDEQSQVGRENTNFQYFPDKLLPVQASSSAKKVKETSRYQKIATTSMCSRASNDMACSSPRRRHEENDLTTSPSNNIEEEKTSSYIEAYQRGHSKRKRNTEVHNMSERKRRAKINKKMRELQELIPNSDKVDKASMLDQAIEYLKNLQLQIQIMQMARSHFTQPMMFPSGMQQIQAPQLGPLFASLGTGMHMGSFGCNPAMYTASSLLGISGQMMPITFSHPPFMSFTGGSSILPNFFPRLPTPGEFLASASLLRSKVSTHDSNSGNDGNDFNSKMKTSSRS